MRAFIYLVGVFAAVVAASSTANPFKIPNGGYTFTAGQSTTLQWTPTTSGTVSLLLQHGEVTTPSEGTPIATGIDNTGTYTWTVPTNLANEAYTIEIISDTNQNDYNFLPRFAIQGASAVASSSSAGPSTSSAAMSSTSTSAEHTTMSSSSESMTKMTTMTTSTSTMTTSTSSSSSATASTGSSSAAIPTSTESSISASVAPSSSAAIPTTNAGLVNRVSGGMLAIVAGAIAAI